MASKFALQEGIITPSTKERLNMLESDKAEIEEQIAKEELALSKQISRDEVEYYLRRAIKSSPKILLNNLVDKVIVYDDKIEIYYKYCHKIPDDPDDQRGYFFEELRIPINCGKRNKQFLPIMIDHQKMIASVKYILNRKKKMLAPINYKKRPIIASQNVTCADGYLLSMTNKKKSLFTAKAGQVSMGAIQRSDKSEIISIWTYRLLTIKLPYSIISINYYIGAFL